MSFVFTETINNSGFSSGSFWIYVLPLGFLLTQYTITGFDACAHVSEETQGAATSAARGLWQSIFYSAIGGWILLLAFLFAATNVDEVNAQFGFVGAIFDTAVPGNLANAIFAISTIGQFFCGMSCVTSMSRMTYAFSRDGAIPGWRLWSKVDQNRTPVNAIIFGCVAALILTLPALYKAPTGTPLAFYAVVSVAVIGLYIAFAIPIWLRLRMGDAFQPGPWTLGAKYKVMSWIAIIEITIVSIYFILPLAPAGVPFASDNPATEADESFTWTAVNYAPIVVGAMVLGVGLWWALSARHWFTGPRRTVDSIDA
jgi:amino acid transporter